MSDKPADPKAKLLLLSLGLVLVVVGIVLLQRMNSKPDRPRSGGKESASGSDTETETETETAPTNPNRIQDSGVVADGGEVRARRDRAARDALRQRIYRSLGQTPPTNSKPLRSADIAREAGVIDAAYVQARIREDFIPMAKECYEAALERDAAMAGRIVMSFNIVGDDDVGGIVESAETTEDTTLVDKELLYCMRESMLSMSFQAPEHGGTVSVVYPFVFSPDDPPPGDH